MFKIIRELKTVGYYSVVFTLFDKKYKWVFVEDNKGKCSEILWRCYASGSVLTTGGEYDEVIDYLYTHYLELHNAEEICKQEPA